MLPQVLNFAAANQNQMINHKLAFELSVTQNDTGDGKSQMQECFLKKTLISFCVLWDDVVLSDFPGDLFYYSYPPLPTAVKFPGIKLLCCCQYKA